MRACSGQSCRGCNCGAAANDPRTLPWRCEKVRDPRIAPGLAAGAVVAFDVLLDQTAARWAAPAPNKELAMSRVLVIYGTTYGHTAKVAGAMAETLRAANIDTEVAEAGKASQRAEHYAAVIVAASVHAGKYQPSVRNWVRDNMFALQTRPTAFVSVCLAIRDTREQAKHDLDTILERFYTETKWRPTVAKSVAGALLYTKYNWFIRRIMKRIVGSAGGDTDISRDYEYTDWADLRSFVVGFAGRIAADTKQVA
jgi:menaquinone-dependent protoporphyrinogen oxidase